MTTSYQKFQKTLKLYRGFRVLWSGPTQGV